MSKYVWCIKYFFLHFANSTCTVPDLGIWDIEIITFSSMKFVGTGGVCVSLVECYCIENVQCVQLAIADKEVKKRWSLRNLNFKFGSRRSSDEDSIYGKTWNKYACEGVFQMIERIKDCAYLIFLRPSKRGSILLCTCRLVRGMVCRSPTTYATCRTPSTSNLVGWFTQYVDNPYCSAGQWVKVKAIFDFVAAGIGASQTNLIRLRVLCLRQW